MFIYTHMCLCVYAQYILILNYVYIGMLLFLLFLFIHQNVEEEEGSSGKW